MLLAATLINRTRSCGLIDFRNAPIGTNVCEKHRRQDALNEVMSCLQPRKEGARISNALFFQSAVRHSGRALGSGRA